MKSSFQFFPFPRIIFKRGGIRTLPDLIKRYGRNLILVTGGKSFLNSESAVRLFSDLKDSGITYSVVCIKEEPSPSVIDSVTGELSNDIFNVVVGIGGGSVLDAGKAISAMMYRKESVRDFLEGVGTKEHPGTKLPFIALPTTSGTGSEATKNAVLSETGPAGFKRSLRHDNFIPDIALVDPELTISCPPDITAASGMDCFTQLTEAFLSDKASPMTDALALEGLKAVKDSIEKVYIDGSDLDARTGMSFAALTSGICLANAGLGVVHGFASSIGGLYKIPHGVICGTLMAAANEKSVQYLRNQNPDSPAYNKYLTLASLFTGKENSDYQTIYSFLDYLHNLTDKLTIPGLKTAGIVREDLDIIASITDCKNNPVDLSRKDLIDILMARYI